MTHAEYMREWRRRNPGYVTKDRDQARARSQRRAEDPAKRKHDADRMSQYRGTSKGMLTEIRRQSRRRRAPQG